MNTRCCSRTACKQPPVYTLTYVYRDSTAVLGPLAAYVDPHCYDLCEKHAARLVVPRGWDVVRLPPDPAQERADDLEALANVVREAGRVRPVPGPPRRAVPRARPRRPLPNRSVRASRSAAAGICAWSAPLPRLNPNLNAGSGPPTDRLVLGKSAGTGSGSEPQ